MKEILQKYLIILKKDRARRKKVLGMLCVLSVIVMLAVAWQLRFVGIAQTDVPSCGLEEHEHTAECIERRLICELKEGEPEPDSDKNSQTPAVHHHGPECYEEIKTLHCEKPVHVHTDECYEIRKTLDCLTEEHSHDASCYETKKNLVCTEDHEHTDACYETEQVLICTKQEHKHDDNCYKMEKVLKCSQQEHSHSDECYTIEKKLICGKEEGQAEEAPAPEASGEKTGPKLHKHTDECYQDVYVCGKKTHKHTLDCYSDPKADVETYEDWEKTLPEKPGRTWGESMLKVAQSQMDYKESTKNFKTAEDGETKLGYTRYGEWYGNPYGEWNTMFVSFCLRYSGIAEEAVPRHSGAFAMTVKLEEMKLLENAEYAPQPGDIVFFQDLEAVNINRCAIVASVGHMIDETTQEKIPSITIIEGDRNNAVSPYRYALDDELIAGYVSMEKAYNRAVELKIPPEPIPEHDGKDQTPEPEPDPTKDPEIDFTPGDEDPELSTLLLKLTAKAVSYVEAEKNEDKAAAQQARTDLEKVILDLKAYHAKTNPEAKKGDFEAFMQEKEATYYNVYVEACKKYPAVAEPAESGTPSEPEPEGNIPEKKPDALNAETVKLLDAMAKKSVEYQYAQQHADEAKLREASKAMNLLYDQAKTLYYHQYPEAEEAAFETYVKTNYAPSWAAMEDAETRFGSRALDAILADKLTAFSQKAKDCAMALNVGEMEKAKNLKLELDQLYLSMQELHGKRYPDADKETFDLYLNNNDDKAVSRYLSAVKAFPDDQVENYVTFTDPVSGETRRIFRLQDGMEVDVLVTGSICFPVEKQTDKPLDAKETTANLQTVANGTTIPNTTQAAAQGSNSDAGSNEPSQAAGSGTAAPDTEKTSKNPAANVAQGSSGTSANSGTTVTPKTDEKNGAADGENKKDHVKEQPEASDQTQTDKTDSRWEHITLDVVPVTEDDELAFAEYIAQHHPNATGMTMLNFKYQYNGVDLDMGNAKVNIVMSPAEKEIPQPVPMISTMMLTDEPQPAGPVIRNAPVANSLSPAMLAAEQRDSGISTLEEKNTSSNRKNQRPVVMTVLEMTPDGKITPVVSEMVDRQNGNIPDLKLVPKKGARHAIVQTLAEEGQPKPVPGSEVYPSHWNMPLPTKYEDLHLRTDPYFNGGSEFTFDKPEATLNYILRNYNYFVFDDVVAENHLVGSLAIQGNAYLKSNAGGTGSGYYVIDNQAPNYIKGRVVNVHFELDDPYKLNILNADGSYNPAIQVQGAGESSQVRMLWVHNQAERFPTYLGTINMPDKEVVIKSEASVKTQTVKFTKQGVADAVACTPKGEPDDKRPSPYYYADNYIVFDDFKNDILSDNKKQISPEGIEIKVPEDFSKIDNSEARCKNEIQTHGYSWLKITNKTYPQLFVKMGGTYKITGDIPEETQIVYYPWDGFEGFDQPDYHAFLQANGKNGVAAEDSPAMRANYMVFRNINTTTHFTGKIVKLLTLKDNTGSFAYYVKDNTQPFDSYAVCNADVAGVKAYKSSSITFMPNAEEVSLRLSCTHVVAPLARVYVGHGPYYGCFIVNQLRSVADHHILPFDKKAPSIPPKFLFEKQIVENGTNRVPDKPEEKFNFSMTPVSFIPRSSVVPKNGKAEYNEGKKVVFSGEETKPVFSGTNDEKGKITFPEFQKILTPISEFDKARYPEFTAMPFFQKKHILSIDGDSFNGYIKQYTLGMGKYTFKINENLTMPDGYVRDNTQYYLELTYGFDELNINWQHGTSQIFNIPHAIYDIRIYTMDGQNQVEAPDNQALFLNTFQSGYTGPELPQSGSVGTTPFVITGFVLMMVPVFLVSARKKRGI